MTYQHLIASLWAATCLTAAAQSPSPNPSPNPISQPLTTVQHVDLQRYQGQWYQIALYPNKFQKSCASNTRAQYTPQASGTIQVINACRTAEGKDMQVTGLARAGRATVLSGSQLSPPQLQVRFAPEWLAWLPWVWGDYWVIQLAADYRYAVIGEPKREFLWVLARETQLSSADWLAIEARLNEQGYDPAKLVREKHLP